jgi:hypothetical protein
MKTIKYITAIMMVLLMGIPTTQAQSARRDAASERNERVAANRKSTRETQKKEAVAERRAPSKQKVYKAQAERKQTVQPNRKVQKPQVERKEAVHTNRQARNTQVQRTRQPNQQAVREANRPVSITNPRNPRSTYRKPDSRIVVRPATRTATTVNKYATERYYGGNHYHYVYPTRNVKVHYHYDTYLNNYHVLYYPRYTHVYWTRSMYRDYSRWYPNYYWRYNYGYRIQTISAFDAKYNLGEVAMVYGRVYATWHNRQTDDYLLFFGGEYPYHQFTVVLPARIARKYSWRPERFFLGEHITVTGLITTFEGVPEIIVKNKRQIGLY